MCSFRIVGFALIMFLSLPAFAQTTEDEILAAASRDARISELTAERVLYAADQALDAAAVIVSTLRNDRLVHEELKRVAEGVPGTRAIIVIGPDGRLKHDSYKYPPQDLDLADRTYFKEGLSRSGLVAGKAVVGRTSGASFVPLVKRIGALTFVAVTSPFALVDVKTDCGDCWSLAIKDDGDLVSIFPPEAQVSPALLNIAVQSNERSGTRIARYRNSVIAVAWIKSERFPIISVAVRGLPDTALPDIDVN